MKGINAIVKIYNAFKGDGLMIGIVLFSALVAEFIIYIFLSKNEKVSFFLSLVFILAMPYVANYLI